LFFLSSFPQLVHLSTLKPSHPISKFLLIPSIQGTPGAVFGGPSLPQQTLIGNNHSHPFNTNFTTTSCEVGLASGCCGGGYVKDAQYVSDGITATTDVHFPYISVPICELDVSDYYV
jgi:hypothetical protein